jgi:hypothetical protein
MARRPSAVTAGTRPMISPVAGFSTAISLLRCSSTVAMALSS